MSKCETQAHEATASTHVAGSRRVGSSFAEGTAEWCASPKCPLPAEDQRHLCELDFERSAVLLAPGCYLNHSCDPNAMRHGVNVFAWHAIEPGEEITIDYCLNAFDDDCTWICLCGGASCSGVVL